MKKDIDNQRERVQSLAMNKTQAAMNSLPSDLATIRAIAASMFADPSVVTVNVMATFDEVTVARDGKFVREFPSYEAATRMKENATVFHDIRNGNRIFLCIATPSNMVEAAKTKYAVERELDPNNCTPSTIKSLINEMEVESGMSLAPSQILREEMGL